jgi:hypothetical protein
MWYCVIILWHNGSSHIIPSVFGRQRGRVEEIFTIEDIGLNLISRREEGRKCPWTSRIGDFGDRR